LPTIGLGINAVHASRAGWEWKRWGSRFTLSEDGLVATMGGPRANPLESDDVAYDEHFNTEPCQAVTCGQPMTEGRHYWEVELTTIGGVMLVVGAVRPDQDCEDTSTVEASSTSRFLIQSDSDCVSLFGNGKCQNYGESGCDGDAETFAGSRTVSHVDEGEQYVFKQGDRIGCMLDLDAGWLRFYRNGVRLRQEFASGVTGPLLRCGESFAGAVTALPGAEMPADAGVVQAAVDCGAYSMLVTVPAEMTGGQMLQIATPSGQLVQVQIPAGLAGGQQFQTTVL
jgi:hypothetical protein